MFRKVVKLCSPRRMCSVVTVVGPGKQSFMDACRALGARCYSSPPQDKSTHTNPERKKTTVATLKKLYRNGEPISMMTAQDYPSGLMVDRAGIDACLVGDSLAMVSLGYDSTNPVTVDEMLHHCRAVARGCKGAFLVGDLPYGSYEVSPEEAIKTAIRFLKEGNVEAVKLEGGAEMAETINRLVTVGVTVMGHIGLTPQRHSALGGFRVQGKTASSAKRLLADALAVQEAGASLVLLEAIPEQVAAVITRRLKIPTIGIGAGVGCSGQILVQNDALGIFDRFVPKFTKNYGNLAPIITDAIRQYHAEVKSRSFPAKQHVYPIDANELSSFLNELGEAADDVRPLEANNRDEVDNEKEIL